MPARWRRFAPSDVARDPRLEARRDDTGRDDTLRAWLEQRRQRAPDAIAIVEDDRDWTYAELGERVDRLAAGLAGLGLAPADVVAVQLPNGSAFVSLYLAITSLGAVMQTVHMPYRAAELDFLLAHGGARVFVGVADFKGFSPAAHALAMRAAGRGPEHVVVLGEGSAAVVSAGAIGFDALLASSAPPPRPELSADHPFLLLYTSGTTANPKGVPHAYRGFLGNARAAVAEFGIGAAGAGERLLSAAPMTHLYGLFVLHLGLASGSAQVILPAFTPPGLAQALTRHRAQRLFAAPAHVAALLGAGLVDRDAMGSLAMACLSGSAVSPQLAAQFEDALPACRVLQLWGMSELQAGAYGRPGDDRAARHRGAGRASPGTGLRVVDDAGTVLPAGREGRLQVRGPSVFAGYLDNPQASAAAFTADGWFDTGDTATLAADGELALTGRHSETINRGGVKFNPVDVELLLERHPAIERCAMVPLPDAMLGERACLFAVARGGAPRPLLDELTAWLDRAGIARFKWPERLEWIDAMPLTPTQKVMRGRLVERLRAGGG